ncbi:MAG: GlmU family protein [Phycisphaerales bacterium]
MTVSRKRPAIFLDDGRGLIAPLVDMRACFDVRTGALTTMERLQAALGLDVIACYVPAELAPLVAEEHPGVPINTLPALEPQTEVLLVNGRCVLPLDVIAELEPGWAAVEEASGDLIAACVDPLTAASVLAGQVPPCRIVTVHDHVLLRRPWDVIRFRDQAVAMDLEILVAGPSIDPAGLAIVAGEHPIRIDPSARVFPGAVLDASKGSIVIDRNAELRPGAVIIGPAYVGVSSLVTEQGVIRPNTAIGPVCKVGGEVSGAVIQGYSNKAHEGFLGDSWVGQWVNLGAGTITSNLLNTYSEISAVAEPGFGRERTGLQFFGCVLGDHVKTAIATRIMGGSVVHTGTMWAAASPVAGCIARFAWSTDAGVRQFRLARFLETMDAMMARRQVRASDAYRDRIRRLHERA